MSVLDNASDLEEALRNIGDFHLIVAGRREFCARLTQVKLHQLCLCTVHELVSRIGLLSIPPNIVLALFSIGDQPSPIWSGLSLSKGEILICGPSHRLHMRTEGPSRWGAVSLPADEFRAYFDRLTDRVLTKPILAQRWRPPAADFRRFTRLHAAAICAAGRRPQTIVHPEAAHGMEQQLIHSLVWCLSTGPGKEASGPHRCQDLVVDLENLLRREPATLCRPGYTARRTRRPGGTSTTLLQGDPGRRSCHLRSSISCRQNSSCFPRRKNAGNCHANLTCSSCDRLARS